MTERTPEDLEKIIATLARLLLEQMDAMKALVGLLTPEQKETLAKIGKLVETPRPNPVNVI